MFRLRGNSIQHPQPPIPLALPSPPLSPRVLELLGCNIAGPELQKLLPHLPRLNSFTIHAKSSVAFSSDYDVGAALQALEDHCAATLTSLSLTSIPTPGVVEGGMWNFARFLVLDDLELDARFFYRLPNAKWHTPLGERTAIEPTELRLRDTLPDTIKRFRLLTETEDFRAYLVGDCLFARWNIDGFKVSPEGRALNFTRDSRSSVWSGDRRRNGSRKKIEG